MEIKVVKPRAPLPDMRMALLYLAVGTACDLIIFIGLMIVRHRQEHDSKMKGYSHVDSQEDSAFLMKERQQEFPLSSPGDHDGHA